MKKLKKTISKPLALDKQTIRDLLSLGVPILSCQFAERFGVGMIGGKQCGDDPMAFE